MKTPPTAAPRRRRAFAGKRGVCQDYAHIFIACARSGGVPARFVSGHFLRSDGTVNQQAGHAWAEAYVPDLGWVGFDPGQRHLHHRRPCPRRHRARLPRRRTGTRHPLWRRHRDPDGRGPGRARPGGRDSGRASRRNLSPVRLLGGQRRARLCSIGLWIHELSPSDWCYTRPVPTPAL